jgi:ketosteroid isomerase-like protein
MSKENVEIVRRVYDAVARGDAETVLALYDSAVEWDFSHSPYRSFLKHDVYRGRDGLRSFIRERYEEAWQSAEDELEELIGVGEQVISVITSRGRGRASGIQVEKTHAGVWTVRDGRVVRVEWMSREDALEAAGLEG